MTSPKYFLSLLFLSLFSTALPTLNRTVQAIHTVPTLDTSAITGFDGYSDKEKDAVLSGWSELKL